MAAGHRTNARCTKRIVMAFHSSIPNDVKETGDGVAIVALQKEGAIATSGNMIVSHSGSETIDTPRNFNHGYQQVLAR